MSYNRRKCLEKEGMVSFEEQTLTDNSKVYNVVISPEFGTDCIISCASKDKAIELYNWLVKPENVVGIF